MAQPRTYDPFARGPHPVGVRTLELRDAERARRLPLELWYPASAAHRGEDLAEATRDRYQLLPALPDSHQDAVRDAAPAGGTHPLVVFSHGFGGHRRQSTFLCTHLASHGYLVAAMDHVGNTTLDVFQMFAQAQGGGPVPDGAGQLGAASGQRPADVSFALDRLLGGAAGELSERIDPARIGATGHSFGGWTTLAVAGRDARVRAALPLAPAGGASAVPGDPLPLLLDFEWRRDVPTLYLVAERDSLLPLSGMRALFERTKVSKRLAILRNADHQHFCDQVEQVHEVTRALLSAVPEPLRQFTPRLPPIGELCPGEHGYLFVRGLGLAHLDAVLKGRAEAAAFLADGAAAALAARGVQIELH